MANVKAKVKNKLKAPKKAKVAKRGRPKKSKKDNKSSTGPKEPSVSPDMSPDPKLTDPEFKQVSIVIKRPTTHTLMTADEKVQYLLQNGHTLKDKFIARQPTNVKPKPEYDAEFYIRKRNTDRALMTKTGCLKKNAKVKMSLINDILMNELILDSANENNSKTPSSTNNNDNAITDQNNTIEDLSDSEARPGNDHHAKTNKNASEKFDKSDHAKSDKNDCEKFDKCDNTKSDINNCGKSAKNGHAKIDKSERDRSSKRSCANTDKKDGDKSNKNAKSDKSNRGKSAKSGQAKYHKKKQDKSAKNDDDKLASKDSNIDLDEMTCLSDDFLEELVKKSASEKESIMKHRNLIRQRIKEKQITLGNGVVLNLTYFECDHCGRAFNRKCSLRRHMMMHLGLKPFVCPHCPDSFRSRYNMQVHVDRYHTASDNNSRIFPCSYCEESFPVKQEYEKHLRTHISKENSFKCIYCKKVYSHHIMLMQHEKKHMIKGYYQCTLCSMRYRCRNRLYDHVKSHLKIKDYICQHCGKGFSRYNSLIRHVEVNHGGHRLVCPICKKNLKGHLTEHMRTHEKKRPHKCPDCGQCFAQATQMNVHRRAHTGVRPYQCRICKNNFSHSNALMLHIRRHTGEKPFPCAMCPMSFSQLPHMKCHMRSIHKKVNPYKCSKCDKFFKLKSEVENHEKACGTKDTGIVASKGKNNKDNIEVESPMPLHRMRYLLALLLTMIATEEKLKFLGFNKRLVDDLLIESLEAMDKTPCKDQAISPLMRLRKNIELLLMGTVPKDQFEMFKKENKSTEDILELLTNEKEK